MKVTRRGFIATTALGSASLALDLQAAQQAPGYKLPAPGPKPKAPVINSSIFILFIEEFCFSGWLKTINIRN